MGQERETLIKVIRSELEHEGISGPISARAGMTIADALLRIPTARAALAAREEPPGCGECSCIDFQCAREDISA
jgi:hypothetical protein